jgi:hypothetical protein
MISEASNYLILYDILCIKIVRHLTYEPGGELLVHNDLHKPLGGMGAWQLGGNAALGGSVTDAQRVTGCLLGGPSAKTRPASE